MKDIVCKLLVIGAGPGGYVCAIRAGQLGVETVIVEESKLGGTCLNVGCIPSKAIIHAAHEFHRLRRYAGHAPIGITAKNPAIDLAATIAWKDGIVSRLNGGVSALLGKAKVKTIVGRARFIDGKTVEIDTGIGRQTVRAEAVVIATGSVPVELRSLPFGGKVVSSADMLSLQQVPEKMAVVGGGYIGLEIGTAFAKLGSAVTVVEAEPRILPRYDIELTRPVLKNLEQLGVRVLTGARAKGVSEDGKCLIVETGSGAEESVASDAILVTVGRKPLTEGWGIEELSLKMQGPFIHVDEACRTSMRGVFAIGDVTGEPMLAHRAIAQGEMVAAIAAGHKRGWDKVCIPAICFTDPEIVVAGLSPEEARLRGIKVKTGIFPFSANGRAMTAERVDGMIRVVARADNHLVLGIQAVGAEISELAASFGTAIEMGARLEDIAGTIHAHPSRGEAIQEAALMALGRALHL